MKKTIWLTAFFRFDDRGAEYGFERIHLQHIWATEQEARDHVSFCDEAGWYTGVLIEERGFGWDASFHKKKRIWMHEDKNRKLVEIDQPEWYNNIVYLIG